MLQLHLPSFQPVLSVPDLQQEVLQVLQDIQVNPLNTHTYFDSWRASYNDNKTGLQPVSRPVEKVSLLSKLGVSANIVITYL